jgi:hypothetical protein
MPLPGSFAIFAQVEIAMCQHLPIGEAHAQITQAAIVALADNDRRRSARPCSGTLPGNTE